MAQPRKSNRGCAWAVTAAGAHLVHVVLHQVQVSQSGESGQALHLADEVVAQVQLSQRHQPAQALNAPVQGTDVRHRSPQPQPRDDKRRDSACAHASRSPDLPELVRVQVQVKHGELGQRPTVFRTRCRTEAWGGEHRVVRGGGRGQRHNSCPTVQPALHTRRGTSHARPHSTRTLPKQLISDAHG